MDNNENILNLENAKRKVTRGEKNSLLVTIANDKLKKNCSEEDYEKNEMNWDLDTLDKYFLTFERKLSSEVTLYRFIGPVQIENQPDSSTKDDKQNMILKDKQFQTNNNNNNNDA